MASTITVTIDPQQLEEVRKMLDGFVGTVASDKGAQAAIIRSLRKTMTHAESVVVKSVSQLINLIQKEIRNYIRESINVSAMTGVVTLSANGIPLVKFPYIAGVAGVSVEVRKSRAPEFFRHRFQAIMKSGHVGIFELSITKPLRHETRQNAWGSTQLPIEEQAGPSVGMVFYENGQVDMEEIADFLARTLDHEVEFILSQAGI